MIDTKNLTDDEILAISREIRERALFPGPYQADLRLEPGPWRPNFVDPNADEQGEALYILGKEREDTLMDVGFTNKYVEILGENTISIREMLPVSCEFKLAPAPGGWDRYVLSGKMPFIVQGWGKDSPLNYQGHENYLTPLMEESVARMAQASFVQKDAYYHNIYFDNMVIEREMEALKNKFAFHFSRDQLKLDELQVYSMALTSDPESEDEMVYYDNKIGLSTTFESCQAHLRYPSVYVDGEMHKAAKLDYRLRYAIMWYMSTLLNDSTVGTSKNPTSTELVDIVAFALRILPREKVNGLSRSIFEYLDLEPTGENVARTRVFETLVSHILESGASLVDPMKDAMFDLTATRAADRFFIADENHIKTLGHGRYKLANSGSVNLNMMLFGPNMAYEHTCNWCKINPVPDQDSKNRMGRLYEGFGIYEVSPLAQLSPVGGRIRIDEVPTEPLSWQPLSTPLRTSIFEYERMNQYSQFHSNLMISIPRSTYLPRKSLNIYNLYWAITTGDKSCLSGSEMVRVGEYPYDTRARKFLSA